MLSPEAKQNLIANYRERLIRYKSGPSVGQWAAVESQTIRFNQLMKLGDFNDQTVLDFGCGLGDFYPVLLERFPRIKYSGIDLVPEIIECAKGRFPSLHFECRDVLERPLIRQYDYVLMSGIFNNDVPDPTDYLKAVVQHGFEAADRALAFNFISNHTEQMEGLSYHDPADILEFCIENLSPKVTIFHHYARNDVCVFVHR